MLRIELKSVVARVQQMLGKQPTYKMADVPQLYHEPGVYTGYRPPGQSIFTYVLSAFQLNNETVNIWTHFIGFLLMLFRTLNLLNEFGVDDTRISPIVGFGVCCMLNTAFSVIAHTLHSTSPFMHYTCFQVDYAGIGLYAFGSALHIFYLGADHQTKTNLNFLFFVVNLIASWFCFLCCGIAKLRYRRPYPFARKLWHIVPFGLHMFTTMSLLYGRISKCHAQTDGCYEPGLDAYKRILFLALLGGLTYSSHLPEKLWPGHFDLIGQGHHVFHVVSVILHLAQFDAAREDLLHYNTDANNDVIPTLPRVLCMLVGLCVLSAVTIVCLKPFVLKRIQDDEMIEKRRE